jgi:hypothetical protein
MNAEFSNAEWDLMPKSRMPNWTEDRMGLLIRPQERLVLYKSFSVLLSLALTAS